MRHSIPRSFAAVALALLAVAGIMGMPACADDVHADRATRERASELRQLIYKNLEAGGHTPFDMVVTRSTIEAVSKSVTDQDVPALVVLSADKKARVRIAAIEVLKRFGAPAIKEVDAAIAREQDAMHLRYHRTARQELTWASAAKNTSPKP